MGEALRSTSLLSPIGGTEVLKSMGRFMDVGWYDLNRTPRKAPKGIPVVAFRVALLGPHVLIPLKTNRMAYF